MPTRADLYVPLQVHGPTGATAATRYAGGTVTGHPTSGTFAVGDYVIAQDGHVWICTVAGSPGTWVDSAGGGGITQLTGDVTAGPGSGSQAATLAASGVTAATYGDSTHIPQITVDAKGRATGITNVAASGTTPSTGTTVQLVYRYTVTVSDKASIDTGVDSPDAGSADWTNGDTLEIFTYSRTDESVELSQHNMVFNNDTGGNYDLNQHGAQGGSGFAGPQSNARANIFWYGPGAVAAGIFGSATFVIPAFSNTVGNKSGTIEFSSPNQTAGFTYIAHHNFGWRSTSAITRVAISPNTAGKKLKVGTRLSIYKRLLS